MRFNPSLVLFSAFLYGCGQEIAESVDNVIDDSIPIIYNESTFFKKDRCTFEEAVEKILKQDTVSIEPLI